MINQKWLTTFLKLAEVGHFTQTAEQLFMTQPGVSQHVQKLEQQLNVQLIQRFGKRFELTDAGMQLQQYGEQALKQQEQFLSDIQLDSPFIGECRFGCSGSLALWLYPHFIDYQILHPELSVSIEAGPNKRVIEQVFNNDIDIGIVTQFVSNPELEVTPIGDDNFCLIVPAAYKDNEISFEQLISLGLISHPDAKHYLQLLINSNFKTEQAGSIPIASYVNQLNQILLPVAKGLGFTVLPEFAVNSFSQPECIFVAKLTHQVKEPLFMIRKKFRPLPKRYDWFIETTTALVNK
ncbi:LysR family transcriptional regulator [Shewanella sp. 1_MG-2023]|uniref:LysR family transcriptional regulator n=1 Tax=unclassified Shewanella TaxID=196818 RepID=UPI0026E19B67|nr:MULTISPECIES: LysR family transcriptional regulator [unclassified Shewanella]MDO6612187.1 LysR family transcriptional regulator [Shewanella sp. 7_MG-2023]MDO6772041.1 LysR family transcriptional regulator [Shewanella sp. 2_MG-2023]MDO6795781.1 LysR family transcriptional regulator [Shewanella sp. 1_MG-2023]